MKRELNILIGMIAVWCGMIVAAPLSAGGGFEGLFSRFMYSFFHTVCHQLDSHSFHIDGHKFAVCIRCTSIYGSFLAGMIAFRLSNRLRTATFDPIRLLLITATPMFCDAVLSMWTGYNATVLSRIVTGSVFGTGMSFLLRDSLVGIVGSTVHYLTQAHSYEFKTR